jgi:hypothetical protein
MDPRKEQHKIVCKSREMCVGDPGTGVHKSSKSVCYTPSSEPFRFCMLQSVYIYTSPFMLSWPFCLVLENFVRWYSPLSVLVFHEFFLRPYIHVVVMIWPTCLWYFVFVLFPWPTLMWRVFSLHQLNNCFKSKLNFQLLRIHKTNTGIVFLIMPWHFLYLLIIFNYPQRLIPIYKLLGVQTASLNILKSQSRVYMLKCNTAVFTFDCEGRDWRYILKQY